MKSTLRISKQNTKELENQINIKIKSTNAWTKMITIVDKLDEKNNRAPKLLCSIEFTESLNDFEIKSVKLLKKNSDHTNEIFQIETNSYEKREHEIMVKNGPFWNNNGTLSVEIILVQNDVEHLLSSDHVNVESVF